MSPENPSSPREQSGARSVDAPVVIVGAGPVGMVLALDLASRGVRSIVIEQSTSTRVYPKGNTHNSRTMEHYRRLGLADAVRAVGLPHDHSADVTFVTRINGHELMRIGMPTEAEKLAQVAAHSVVDQIPEPLHRGNQMYVEQVVFRRLLSTEAVTTRLGTEFLGFEEHDDVVSVRVRPAEGGPEQVITCQYLVGCDGGGSLVRRQMGISYEGEEESGGFLTGRRRSKYVRIPGLVDIIREPSWQYWMVRQGKVATLITLDAREEFRMTVVEGDTEDDEALNAFVDDLVGQHVEVEVLGSQDWVSGLALVAACYRTGRVLICGDAAHLFTPTGGFGMNTGVDDTANLGWKLAAAVQGWAGPGLVDSYEAERRPAGLRNTRAALDLGRSLYGLELDPALDEDTPEGARARADLALRLQPQRDAFASLGVQLGTRYENSPIIWADGTPAPEENYAVYEPSGRPGGRAPHLWLSQKQSLFDALGPGFTLLRLAEDAPRGDGLLAAARQRGVPLTVVDVALPEARGLYGSGLALIRPDQHVAWRGDELPDVDALLDRVTGA